MAHGICLMAALVITLSAPAPCRARSLGSRQRPSYATGQFQSFVPSDRPPIAREAFPLQLVFVGPNPSGLDDAAIERAVSGAARAWSDVACSYASAEYAGRRATLSEVDVTEIPIYMGDPDVTRCLRVDSDRLLGAAPCPLGDALGIALNDVDFDWIMLDALDDVPLYDENQPESVDLRSTITHELGHIFGLSHPPSSDPPLSTMHANYRTDGGQATLAADDRAGICAIYPIERARQTCHDDAHCQQQLANAGASCVQIDRFFVCEEERGQLGDYCASDLLHCPGLCLITDEAARTGYCSVRCDGPNDTRSCTNQAARPLSCQEIETRTPQGDTSYACRSDTAMGGDGDSGGGCASAHSTHGGRSRHVPWALTLVLICCRRRRRRS